MNVITTTDADATRDFLNAALTEVRNRPWIQHATRRESDGGVCATGALFAAQVTARRHGQAVSGWCLLDAHDRLERAATALTGTEVTIPMFNDYHAQTKLDIIRLYEMAIADCL
ncbi:hypothetical protein [Actinomadura sp. 9N215]|uniref:DUF6197 family protein n=1 Tax=Actinomadura sp. 9N215 TaxID=3375150 RepID=UPI00378AAE84